MTMAGERRGPSTAGIFVALLSVSFITLKLAGCIDWQWVWVLSPLWLPLAVVLCTAIAVRIVKR